MRLRTSIITLISLMLVLAMTACGTDKTSGTDKEGASSSTAAADNGKKIKVNIATQSGLIPLMIAKEKGWFEEQFAELNATVEWSEFPSGPATFEALSTGRIDLMYSGDGPVLGAQAGGLNFKEISIISEGKRANSIIVPADSKITTVAELKGKQIAMAKGTTAHPFLIKELEKAGLKESDVKIVSLTQNEAQPAFESGAVDAWATIDSSAYVQISKNGAKVIGSSEKDNIPGPAFNVVRTAFAEEHPELVVKYLEIFNQAIKFQSEQVDESIEIYAKVKKIDKALVADLLKSTPSQNNPISKEIIEGQQKSADIFFNSDVIKKKIDVSQVVDNSFIEQIKQ